MRIFDLTLPIGPETMVYPGDPKPRITGYHSIDENGYYTVLISMLDHTGTHVDAPAHMIKGGTTIDQLSMEKLVGPAIIIDARGKTIIDKNLIRKNIEKRSIENPRFILIATGWQWNERFDHPILTRDAAKYIIDLGATGLGIDTPSPDKPPYEIHKLLLSNSIIIIENLANLTKLLDNNIHAIPLLIVAPIPISKASGAPARVIAIIP